MNENSEIPQELSTKELRALAKQSEKWARADRVIEEMKKLRAERDATIPVVSMEPYSYDY